MLGKFINKVNQDNRANLTGKQSVIKQLISGLLANPGSENTASQLVSKLGDEVGRSPRTPVKKPAKKTA